MLVFQYSLAIPEPEVNGSFASISRIISLFSKIGLLMKAVRSVITFSQMSVNSCPSFSSISHCCVVVVDMPVSGDFLHGLYAFIIVTLLIFSRL